MSNLFTVSVLEKEPLTLADFCWLQTHKRCGRNQHCFLPLWIFLAEIITASWYLMSHFLTKPNLLAPSHLEDASGHLVF